MILFCKGLFCHELLLNTQLMNKNNIYTFNKFMYIFYKDQSHLRKFSSRKRGLATSSEITAT